MSKILYGVSGEGSGHSSRARVMAGHLISAGHEVKIVSYDRGFRNLCVDFDCLEIEGLHIVSINNRVRLFKTLLHNLGRLQSARKKLQQLRELFQDFKPDCVITDFEPATAWMASRRRIPLISLDNQHRMRYMKFTAPRRLRLDQWLTQMVIRTLIPSPDVSLATTFFRGELMNDKTFLFPPILRNEVLAKRAETGNHHLVYLTSQYDGLMDVLKQFPERQFRVYGYNKNETDGNLEYREFSSAGFLNDLAQANSVIATAGFTLISEAIYLQKPYLAFPMHGQFEQQLNALCLEELGYGVNAKVADKATLSVFFEQLPFLSQNLRTYPYAYGGSPDPDSDYNSQITRKLDELLADKMSLLLAYHLRPSQLRPR